jgi:ethanolamine utilization protein EutN
MILARVIGNVVATQKNRRYEGARVMICQPITPAGEETGATLLALDSVDAGEGDAVIIVQEGWGASTAATGEVGAAIDAAIIGVVDRVDLLADEKAAG